jgi:hypothetical protein
MRFKTGPPDYTAGQVPTWPKSSVRYLCRSLGLFIYLLFFWQTTTTPGVPGICALLGFYLTYSCRDKKSTKKSSGLLDPWRWDRLVVPKGQYRCVFVSTHFSFLPSLSMAPGGIHLYQTFSFPCLPYDKDTRCATADFIGLLNSRLGLLHGAAGVGVTGGIFGVTPDTTLLGFPSGNFLFICAYISWCKRLHTEWVLGLCNWITDYFSKEHQFTVDGYLIFYVRAWVCVFFFCVCVPCSGLNLPLCTEKVERGTRNYQSTRRKIPEEIYFAAEPWYHAEYVFQIILTINRHCFPIQHWPTGLCNGSILCYLRDADSIYMQIEFSFW